MACPELITRLPSRGLVWPGWAFDEYPFLEGGAGSRERGKVLAVDRPTAVLRGFEQLECHRQPSGSATWTLGELGLYLTVVKVDSIEFVVFR